MSDIKYAWLSLTDNFKEYICKNLHTSFSSSILKDEPLYMEDPREQELVYEICKYYYNEYKLSHFDKLMEDSKVYLNLAYLIDDIYFSFNYISSKIGLDLTYGQIYNTCVFITQNFKSLKLRYKNDKKSTYKVFMFIHAYIYRVHTVDNIYLEI